MTTAQYPRNADQIAGIKSDNDRIARGFVDAGTRCPALADQQMRRICSPFADHREMVSLDAASQEPLVAQRIDALDRVDDAVDITQADNQPPLSVDQDAVRLDALSEEIGVVCCCWLGLGKDPLGLLSSFCRQRFSGWLGRCWRSCNRRPDAYAFGHPIAGTRMVAAQYMHGERDKAAATTCFVVEPLSGFGTVDPY